MPAFVAKVALEADIELRSAINVYRELKCRNHLSVYFPRFIHAAIGITDLSELPSIVGEWVGTGNKCDILVTANEGSSVLEWMHRNNVYPPLLVSQRMRELMIIVLRCLKTIGELREFGVSHQEALSKNISVYGIFLTVDALVFEDGAPRIGPWNEDRGVFTNFKDTFDGADAFTFIESIWRMGPLWVRNPEGLFSKARQRAFGSGTFSMKRRQQRSEYPCFLEPCEYHECLWTTWSVYTAFDTILTNNM